MNKLQYYILLLSVTAVWSSEMILMKNIPSDISPFAVLTMTNGIGALLLGAAFFNKVRKGIRTREVFRALVLSVLNIVYNSLIILGLRFMDSAAGSVFISFTLAVIPIMLLVMGRKVTVSNFAGMAVVSLGIVLAGLGSIGTMDIKGPAIMLAVCVTRAFYIIKMNDFAKDSDPGVLAVLINISVAVISFALWFAVQPGTFRVIGYSDEMLSSIFMDGFLVCGYAAFINLVAQKYASPATCGAIYSFQIIFAVILAAVIPDILGQSVPITLPKAAGCLLIVGGTLCSELDLFRAGRRKKNA